VFLVATMGAVALVDNNDDSDAGYIISSDTDYVQTSKSFTFNVYNGSDATVYCKWNLNNSSGKSQSNGSTTINSGATGDISVTAPSAAGDYRFVVKFYNNSDYADDHHIADREKSLKVVEPVTIKVTFENKSVNKITFNAYLMVKKGDNWEKVDGSNQDVTVSAYNETSKTNGTGTYSYQYVVKDLDRTTYYKVCSDDEVAKGISGLNTEMKIYTTQNSYDLITWFLVIILIILIIIIIWVYRKPVKNYGKPKGRK